MLAPNLRVILLPHNKKDESTTVENFTQINYYRMSVLNFQVIEIEMRSSSGELIPFEYGSINILLHIKRRNTSI